MLPINKGQTPRALSDAVRRIKTTPNATLSWDAVDSKERAEVLDSLLVEQGHLCAYCSRRIDAKTAHVEHYVPQSAGSGRDDPDSVSYVNLLAVCDGFEGDSAGQTCDRARGNTPLTVNPLRAETLGSIRFARDGTIRADDGAISRDLDKTLNLNQELLRRNRREALRRMEAKLRQVDGRGGADVASYCRCYVTEQLNKPEHRVPYDDILIYFMSKRARARA